MKKCNKIYNKLIDLDILIANMLYSRKKIFIF